MSSESPAGPFVSCPLPITDVDRVLIGHGSGGRLTARLIEDVIVPAFRNPILERLDDVDNTVLVDPAPCHKAALAVVAADRLDFGPAVHRRGRVKRDVDRPAIGRLRFDVALRKGRSRPIDGQAAQRYVTTILEAQRPREIMEHESRAVGFYVEIGESGKVQNDAGSFAEIVDSRRHDEAAPSRARKLRDRAHKPGTRIGGAWKGAETGDIDGIGGTGARKHTGQREKTREEVLNLMAGGEAFDAVGHGD